MDNINFSMPFAGLGSLTFKENKILKEKAMKNIVKYIRGLHFLYPFITG